MLHTLLTKITEGLSWCCGLHPERRRRCFNELDLLDRMTQEELREYIRKLKKQTENCLSEQLLLRTIRIYLLFLRVDLKPAPAKCRRSGTACA